MRFTRRLRHAAVLAPAVAAVLAACRGADRTPAPQADQPATAATTTTTTTTTTTMPSPPPVWRAARWGMTPVELLAVFPGEAQRPAQPATFVQGEPGAAEVAIPAWEADGTRFRVLFGFAGGGLGRLQLAAAKAQAETCYDVEKRLSEEHGAPSSQREATTSVQTKEVVWSQPAQTITLTCVDKPSLGFRTVSLDYAAVSAGTARETPSSPGAGPQG